MNLVEENPSSTPPKVYPSHMAQTGFDFKLFLIIFLAILLLFASVGVNLFGLGYMYVKRNFYPWLSNLLKFIGVSSGEVIINSADVASDIARTGIDLSEGVAKDVGNILIGDIGKKEHGYHNNNIKEPEPDVTGNSIQNSLSSSKTKWCLAGEYQSKRGCIDVTESDKCLSGQVFPDEEMCLNPTLGRSK